MSKRLITTVRIRTTQEGKTVIHDTLTGEEITGVTSLEIFETAAHHLVAVIKRVAFVGEIDVVAAAEIEDKAS